jgi:hypothetical protein
MRSGRKVCERKYLLKMLALLFSYLSGSPFFGSVLPLRGYEWGIKIILEKIEPPTFLDLPSQDYSCRRC